MKMKLLRAGFATLMLVLLTGALVMGSSGGINGRFALTSGGGQMQANGFNLQASIGQPVAGAVGSDTEHGILCSGLVCAGQTRPINPSNSEHLIFLPTIINTGN